MHIGRYQLARKLAAGGMAEVFLAKAEGPGGFEKTLVLKRILPHLAEDPSFVEMFLDEAKLAARLEHPNIVQVFDFGQVDGAWFLAMEYIDGPTVRRFVRRGVEQPLPPALCAKLVALAAEGLAYAHDSRDPATGESLGLIHRDVSPANILVSLQGAVKVVDFGIAKAAGQGHRTQAGVLKGKLAYMPPEQLQLKPLDRRVDIYALGMVLYELLTGRRPFQASSQAAVVQAVLSEPFTPASQWRPDLPPALLKVLDRALAKDRDKRYPDCRAMQAELERFVLSTGEPVGAYQIGQLARQVATDIPSGPMPGTPSPRTPPPSTGRAAAGPDAPSPNDLVTRTWGTVTRKMTPSRVLVLALVGGGLFMVKPGSPLPAQRAVSVAPASDTPHARTEVEQRGPAPEVPPPSVPTEVAAGAETTEASGAPAPEPRVQDDATGSASGPQDSTEESPARQSARPPSTSTPRGAGKGTLKLRIWPYADVFVDGKSYGQTPIAPLELSAGRHTVKAVNAALGREVTDTVEIEAGTATVYKLNFEDP
ncbi:protein kinase [Pyxidicoccus parkwayensis]|uniref:Protein kinase n=1 Tax=Pyxidicoccus parkwayensis TaxID=2813578 RepID=A0ABX7NPQ3_9BACT|nr:serine/threonine-protein kinase [Pyxidicoccus parkwaysis]QSQ19507.1 protein kinase [Pyxidicoccus parkwaysis]